MGYRIKSLVKMGLTNAEAPDLGDLACGVKNTVRRAYCSSYKCQPRDKNGQKKAGGKFMQKNVSNHAFSCPDCGNVLFWERTKG